MDTKHKILTLTSMLLSRAPKKMYPSPPQKSYKYFSQKVEEMDTSEVFTYTPEKVLSKEKINSFTKPLDKFLDERVIKKQQERANPFDTPRDVTSADITAIKVKDNQSSLSSVSKLLRMYISNNLEKNGRQIVLDSTLENLFSEDQIQDLYNKNKREFTTKVCNEVLAQGPTELDTNILKVILQLGDIKGIHILLFVSTLK
uniref:Uncharacterized protein n=1 Tax=Physcomitrium patens TaxID=3218 RepID=A0A7I4EI64_PHYPA